MIGDHETRSRGGRSFKNKPQRSDDDLLGSPPARFDKYADHDDDEVGPFRSPLREDNMDPSQEERRVRREQQYRRRNNTNHRFSSKRNNYHNGKKDASMKFTENEFPPLTTKSSDSTTDLTDGSNTDHKVKTASDEHFKSPNWAEMVNEQEKMEKTKESVSRRRLRLSESSACSGQSEVSTSQSTETESDEAVLARRQKQIDYGKNTEDYCKYVAEVKRNERKKCMPKTPCKYQRYSRRAWDGLVRTWKKKIHMWEADEERPTSSMSNSDVKDECLLNSEDSMETQSQDSGCLVNEITSPDVEQSKKFFEDDSLDLGNEST